MNMFDLEIFKNLSEYIREEYFTDHITAKDNLLVLDDNFWEKIPEDLSYMAMDEDGELYAFSHKPVAEKNNEIIPLNGSQPLPC